MTTPWVKNRLVYEHETLPYIMYEAGDKYCIVKVDESSPILELKHIPEYLELTLDGGTIVKHVDARKHLTWYYYGSQTLTNSQLNKIKAISKNMELIVSEYTDEESLYRIISQLLCNADNDGYVGNIDKYYVTQLLIKEPEIFKFFEIIYSTWDVVKEIQAVKKMNDMWIKCNGTFPTFNKKSDKAFYKTLTSQWISKFPLPFYEHRTLPYTIKVHTEGTYVTLINASIADILAELKDDYYRPIGRKFASETMSRTYLPRYLEVKLNHTTIKCHFIKACKTTPLFTDIIKNITPQVITNSLDQLKAISPQFKQIMHNHKQDMGLETLVKQLVPTGSLNVLKQIFKKEPDIKQFFDITYPLIMPKVYT